MENIYTYYLQVFFILLILSNHAFEFYLCSRQIKAIRSDHSKLPLDLISSLSPDDLKRAVNYTESKLNYFKAQHIWSAAILFFWFPLKGAEFLYQSLPLNHIHKEVFFFCSFILFQALLDIPWSIYFTFVIEKKFGFNKTTPKTFFKDRLIGLLIFSFLGIPVLYFLFFLFNIFYEKWWILAFLSLAFLQFFLAWIYPIALAPLFNKFEPINNPELQEGIENLLSKAKFKSNGIFMMDASKRSSHANAYFTGIGKNKRIVFFDTLLKDLLPREIFAILAHEIGHMKLKHIPKSFALNLVFSFVGFWIMGIVYEKKWFFNGHFIESISPAMLFLIFSTAITIYLFWFKPLSSWFSRKNEFEADQYAAKETSAKDLVDALIKLYQKNASPIATDRLYSLFYHSHPPAEERIKKLLNCPT